MLQAIALAITGDISLAIENLTERFIRLVLEEFELVGNPGRTSNRLSTPGSCRAHP
jgi:hypothetical protein